MRFPESTEIRYLAEPPEPGSRLRSASGREWFVADVLPSGRNTYTVFCMGRHEFLAQAEAASARGRILADDLVALARSVRGGEGAEGDRAAGGPGTAGGRGMLRPYIASVVDSDGRALEYVLYAMTAEEAEREARDGARDSDATLVDVRRWEQASVERPRARSRLRWLQSLFRRRATSH